MPAGLHDSMMRLFAEIQRDSRILIFVKDRQSNIVFGNEAFLELYPPAERKNIIGIPDNDRFNESEVAVYSEEDRKAFDEGSAEIIEQITDYAGRLRTLHTRKVRITDDGGRDLILGMAIDISALSEREKALAKSNLALENFAAIAAHDLRSPMAAMQTSLDAIKDDGGTVLSARATRYISLMQASLDGLIEQVSNLLKACKVQGQENLVFEDCDIPILFEEVRYNLSAIIQASRAKVLSTYLPNMRVNKPMFRQLLHNLIENSIKYRSDVAPIVVLRYEHFPDRHSFSVEDNGIGISHGDADRIFGMGVQVRDNHEGLGIGLALCRRIVEAHKGRIYVDTGYDRGCRICFDLPL